MNVGMLLFLAGTASLAVGRQPTPLAESRECLTPSNPIVLAGAGARIDTALTRLDVFGYSGAVVVSKDGEVILRKAYGWADRSRGRRNTTETPFELAVQTKPFTAAAILSLVDEGKLALTDSIGRFYPELPAGVRAVTVERLLTHTSGAPSSIGGPSASRDDFVRRIGAAMWTTNDRTFRYSSPGYVMLAAIVDKVAAGGYRGYVATRVLRPLGMGSTFFRGDASRTSCVARGYSGWRDVSTTVADTSWTSLGATHLVATVGDLHAWGKSWPRGLFDRHWVFNDSAYFGYGGVTRLTPRGTRYLHGFSGGTPGYQTEVAAFPEEGVVWASISNAADVYGRSIGFTAQDYMIGAMFSGSAILATPPVATVMDDAGSRAIAGEYRLVSGARIVVRGSADSLVIAAIGQEAVNALEDPEPSVRARADSLSRVASRLVFPRPSPGDSARSVNVVGTVIDRFGQATTTVDVAFAEQRQMMIITWNPGAEPRIAAGGRAELAIRPLRRTPDGSLVAWDIARGRGVRIEHSEPRSLTIHGTSASAVVAVRQH